MLCTLLVLTQDSTKCFKSCSINLLNKQFRHCMYVLSIQDNKMSKVI